MSALWTTLAYPSTHVQLNIAALLEALLERLFEDGAHRRTSGGLHKSIHLGSQDVIGRRGWVKVKRVDDAAILFELAATI